ncbi:right-handed parallel beta-helix repeat-containing protein [Microbacterium sp. P04]|uniref:right-handed parallel beta-helix repeat-containing protein n=1 Tax=Microbacterium sp. P04 TaxID=3366947 RepID=UPI003745F370
MRAWTAVAIAVVAALTGAGVAVTAATLADSTAEPEAYGLNEIARNGNVQGILYPGDPATEAALVQQEDERIVYTRRVASAAYWTLSVDGPYRFRTGDSWTIVLPGRELPYTVDDLRSLAPDTLVQNPDGSYLLRENVAVMQGATLSLNSVEVRLESTAAGFTSIVAFGGHLDLAGTRKAPTTVTSWDSATDSPDEDTADGRAYLRAIGGSIRLSHADISSLGFWGGSTGGLAITGNDEADDTTLASSMEPTDDPLPVPAGAPVVDATAVFETTPPEDVEGMQTAASAGTSAAPREDLADLGLSTATILDSEITGNAFGIFVSSAENVTIERTVVTDSLVDGITLHRSVSSSRIADSQSSRNAVDGISLGRSTVGIRVDTVTVAENGRNGVSMDGQSLADGPSASGTAVESFGDNSVVGSTIDANGRYGMEITGGGDIDVSDNRFTANPDGLVVDRGADAVSITGNQFLEQTAAAVAIRDDVTDATVQDNTIRGGDTGIHVRNAAADVSANTLSDVTNHAVTLLGDVEGTAVAGNELGGTGQTALWSDSGFGAVIGENDLDSWRPAITPASVVGFVFQPLTVVWLLLALLLVGTALTRKDGQYGKIRDPYAERVPLTSLTRGVVSMDGSQGASVR